VKSKKSKKSREEKHKEIREKFKFDYENARTNIGKNFFFQLYWFAIGWLFDNSKEDVD
jgi:hypothetical protein